MGTGLVGTWKDAAGNRLIINKAPDTTGKIEGTAIVKPPEGGPETETSLSGTYLWVGPGGHAFVLSLSGNYRDGSRGTAVSSSLCGFVNDFQNFDKMLLQGGITQGLADGHGKTQDWKAEFTRQRS